MEIIINCELIREFIRELIREIILELICKLCFEFIREFIRVSNPGNPWTFLLNRLITRLTNFSTKSMLTVNVFSQRDDFMNFGEDDTQAKNISSMQLICEQNEDCWYYKIRHNFF